MIPREPTPTERLRAFGHFWATTFIGLAVAILLTTRASDLAGRITLNAGVFAAIPFLLAAGVVDGVIIGGAQWMALSRFVPASQRGAWLLVCGLGMGAAWTLALGIGAAATNLLDPNSAWVAIAAIAGGCAIGASIGGAQWWVLGRTFTGAGGWITSSALGWCLTIVPVFVAAPGLLAGRMRPSDVVSVVTFGSLCAGLGAGVIAVGLEALVRRRRDLTPHGPAGKPKPRRVLKPPPKPVRIPLPEPSPPPDTRPRKR